MFFTPCTRTATKTARGTQIVIETRDVKADGSVVVTGDVIGKRGAPLAGGFVGTERNGVVNFCQHVNGRSVRSI